MSSDGRSVVISERITSSNNQNSFKMKNATSVLLAALLFVSTSVFSQTYDDVYDAASPKKGSNTPAASALQKQESGNADVDSYRSQQYSENSAKSYGSDDEYIDYDDDDYYYASRIRRFNNSFWRFGYYSPFFMDPYWWDMSYNYPSFSIGWGYPSWYYGNNWGYNNWNNYGNNWGYNNWNNYGCYSGFNNWNRWGGGYCGWNNYGNNYGYGYHNGYNQGYWNGYWDGFYNNNNNYGNGGYKSSYVYGPRMSVNSGVRNNRGSIRSSTTTSPVINDGMRAVRTNASPINTIGTENAVHSNGSHDVRNDRNQMTDNGGIKNSSSRIGESGINNERSSDRYPYQNSTIKNQQPERTNRDRILNQQQMQDSNSGIRVGNGRVEGTRNNDRMDERQQQTNPIRERNDEQQAGERQRTERQQREQQRMNEERNRVREQRYQNQPQQNNTPEPRRYESPRNERRSESPRMESPRMQSPMSGGNGGGRRR